MIVHIDYLKVEFYSGIEIMTFFKKIIHYK